MSRRRLGRSPRRSPRRSPSARTRSSRSLHSYEHSRREREHRHDYHNLLDVGTGVWWMMETIAFNANTPERFASFSYDVDIVARNFVCQECKEHFQKFREEKPLENFMLKPSGEFDTLGAYRWVWMAHNNANRITGKSSLPLDQALEFQQKQAQGESCTSCSVSSSSTSSSMEEREEREKVRRERARRGERENTFRVRFSNIE